MREVWCWYCRKERHLALCRISFAFQWFHQVSSRLRSKKTPNEGMTNRTDYDEWASAAVAAMWARCELRAAEVLAWLDEEWL